jgi:hypothetical protein
MNMISEFQAIGGTDKCHAQKKDIAVLASLCNRPHGHEIPTFNVGEQWFSYVGYIHLPFSSPTYIARQDILCETLVK